MNDTRQRLIRCLRAVFPELRSDEEALHARASGVAAWDSLATVTVAAAVEEEFDVQVNPGELEKLDSFERYLGWLNGRASTTDSAGRATSLHRTT